MSIDPKTAEGRTELRELLARTQIDRLRVGKGPVEWRTLLTGNDPGIGLVHLVNSTPALRSVNAELIVAAVNALPALLDALDKAEAELVGYRAEEQRVRAWNALVNEGNVRCTQCDLRYAERDQYGCGDERYNAEHHYDADELAEARRKALEDDV